MKIEHTATLPLPANALQLHEILDEIPNEARVTSRVIPSDRNEMDRYFLVFAWVTGA